jgi:DNA invertase Pin-like site-specific DNA recombinase
MRVVGYIRVSTEAQAERGLGLQVQERAVRSHCQQHGWKLATLHRDEGVSGSLADRPGLAAAIVALEDGGADGLVVYRLDRLARSLVVQETVIERLGRRGIRVFSVTEADIDGDDATRVLIRQVLGAIGQYERALITARLQAGRAAKAARGGYAYGAVPFGWRVEGGRLVPHRAEQQGVAMAAGLRAQGRSLREIARELDGAGYKPRRAAKWSAEGVRMVLARALRCAE